MFSNDLDKLAKRLVKTLQRRGWHVTCAESCSGGLLAGCLTSVPGASVVFDRGFVTYHNDAKVEMLGVHIDLLKAHGAVSAPVALAMAEGALKAARADLALAVTGIAGPGGGSEEKPVGLVHIAAARHNANAIESRQIEEIFPGNRDQIRLATVEAALKLGIFMAQDGQLGDPTR